MCLPLQNLERVTLAKGEHAGFEWQVVHNTRGYRCGYVKVLPGHPWFGKFYDDVAADVHGGLTFSAHGDACPTHGPEAEWWVGFDCAHALDAPDPSLLTANSAHDFGGIAILARSISDAFDFPASSQMAVRDQPYVEAECRSLCDQAAAA